MATITEAAATRRQARPVRRRRVKAAPYLFVVPFVLVFAAFSAYPIFFALQLSFTNWHGAGVLEFIGFANYRYLLASPDFWQSMATSGALWLLVVPAQVLLALTIAVALRKARFRGLFSAALIAPFVTPLVAMAQVWIILFDQDFGAVNHGLASVGLPAIGWLTTSAGAKVTVALLVLWRTTGYAVILLMAGLSAIPSDVYEAARIDGASAWHQFWSITVPLVTRTLSFVVVIGTLTVFQLFAEPYVVTGGGPFNSTRTAGLHLYKHITNSDLGLGAANSMLLVVMVLALSLASIRLLRSREDS
ncbi:multiple sugar transport system permease protein/cellobiose transport system permease protein [Kribbella antiqua]|uniref:Multiple sugar transport system permease protein/cellobiose transport system permease protein n=1 Tax=Kribbella antiqua TaxID=2512217 RepID=A0A4R2I849_9ACTN|nr:sugar ABC transporter permease [Kribbella antiqua]TCO40514.1 multiple sugar transport system permease protein/cellobiose transport system permease protein [Kribbella antiqua]